MRIALLCLMFAGPSLAQSPPDAPRLGPPPAGAPAPAPPMGPPVLATSSQATPRVVERPVARAARQGNEALREGRVEDATAAYDAALVKAPDLAELAYNRGLAALMAGKLDEAKQAFELADRLRESPPDASHPRASVPEKLGEDTRFNEAHVAWGNDDVAEAVKRWGSIVAAHPETEDARRNLELALRRLAVEQQQQQQQQQEKNDEQKEDEKKQQQESEQEQQQQEQEQKQDEQPQQPQDQPQQPEERPGQMSREQADELLDALDADEKREMQERQDKQGKPARAGSWRER